MSSDPLVSICTITYNHEQFIAQAIEGVLMQQCNFRFEMVIGEDCSKDNTRQIIAGYAEKYPDIIVPLYAQQNIGAKLNSVNSLMKCRGKYIAFLEGDDYWTDPTKLQRQFDFLEANPDFAICFTKVDVVDDAGNPAEDPFPPITGYEFSIEDVIASEKCFMPTATLFFRNTLPRPLPKFFTEAMSGDIAMQLMTTDKGKAKLLPGKTAVYREHSGGITKTEKSKREANKKLFEMFADANEYFEFRHDKAIRQRLLQMSKIKLIFGSKDLKGFKKIKYVIQNASDYFKYSEGINPKEITYYFFLLFFPSLLRLRK